MASKAGNSTFDFSIDSGLTWNTGANFGNSTTELFVSNDGNKFAILDGSNGLYTSLHIPFYINYIHSKISSLSLVFFPPNWRYFGE
jgi:hypothetical protein